MKSDESPASSNDFVIRDGFPALYKSDGSPLVEGDEPIPQQPFLRDHALEFANLGTLQEDCTRLFAARTRENDQAYSAGVTYFLPASMKPRCALEALVQCIFERHTEGIDYKKEQSGAEWWTLVLDSEDKEDEKQDKADAAEDDDDEEEEADEVGMHFDADYGLEDQAPNLLLHPRLASVTYLSDWGAPTLVLDRRSHPPSDTTLSTLAGPIAQGWLSHPSVGKHIIFDGRLLHGAPAAFFPPRIETNTNKKPRLERKRYSLLVNIWLNHCPLDAEPLEEDIIETLHKKADFAWSPTAPPEMASVTLSSSDDPAGSEETVLCGRQVTFMYNASEQALKDCSTNSTMHIAFAKEALVLQVGDVVEDDDTD